MTWQQIRERHPHQWVVMEALQAHDDGDRRVFDTLGVLDICEDAADVLPRYREFKRQFPEKEIIFYHADKEVMDVKILRAPGLRWRT